MDTKAAADRVIDTLNSHDQSRVRELFAANATFGEPNGSHQGQDAATAFAMGWFNAFPDARVRVTGEVIGDGTAAQQFVFEGTHMAPLPTPAGPIEATGRQIAGRGLQVAAFDAEGRATSVELYYDQVDVMTQLGLMPG